MRAWRGELSSKSIMEQRASATAWSDTAWHLSSILLSCKIVDLERLTKDQHGVANIWGEVAQCIRRKTDRPL